MRAGGQCTGRAIWVSTWTDDDVGRPSDVGSRRKRTVRLVGFVVAVVVLVAACSSGSSSPAPSGGPATYALRATTHQAIPPEAQFTWLPYAVITDDGVVVTQGPVPIFLGPRASITEAGFNQIVERARALGLLDGDGDFAPREPMPGALSGIIELRVDGAMREISGDPNSGIQCITTPCEPEPGSPEAFGTFWRELGDMRSLVGDELGADSAYHPDGYAFLIGVKPPDDSGLDAQVLTWPLETPLAETGVPVGDAELPRCATIEGEDWTATLEAAFAGANELTQWVDAGGDPADAVSIAVRPLLPGDDPCMELFGVDA